ncbi:MAG TPA: YCF48-related protein, partial [Ignavibacteriaceae bacterium]|nr:YCF48-related protein [Ignavibacteriaceae bacterium]
MKKISILILLILINSIYAQWEKQTAPDFKITEDLYSISYGGENTFYAVGQNGRIIESNDNGKNWSFINAADPASLDPNFKSVFFINKDTGWVISNNGFLFGTQNGGKSWDDNYQAKWYEINANFSSLFFINYHTGWICGENETICKINNEPWTGGIELQNSGAYSFLQSIYFIDSLTGWTCGSAGEILSTINGGLTWNKQIVDTNYFLSSVYFVNSSLGWISGISTIDQSGIVLKTTNGGVNWNLEYNTEPNEGLYTIKFKDADTGITAGNSGAVYITTDGGLNWINKNIGNLNSIRSICYDAMSNIVLAGLNGLTLLSTDSGNSWKDVNHTYNIYSVCFYNKNLGWASGDEGIILKTTNGGNIWRIVESNYFNNLGAITFVDSLNGWILGSSRDSSILRTTNGGESWNKINVLKDITYSWPFHVYLTSFIDSLSGWIIAMHDQWESILLKSIDGGNNWVDATVSLPFLPDNNFTDIYFLN